MQGTEKKGIANQFPQPLKAGELAAILLGEDFSQKVSKDFVCGNFMVDLTTGHCGNM